MAAETIELTRAALYEQVWSAPMRTLAKQFGLSDVGLAKVCKRHNIPRPPMGYWARREFGKSVEKIALPPCTDLSLEMIRFSPASKDQCQFVSKPFFDAEIAALAEQEEWCLENLIVPPTLRAPHLLIQRTKEGLLKCRKEKRPNAADPLIRPYNIDDKPSLDITIGRDSIDRALKLLDVLLKGIEARGFCFKEEKQSWRGHIYFEGYGESFSIKLREKMTRSDHVPTAQEKLEHQKWRWKTWPKWDFTPSGIFELTISFSRGWAVLTLKDGKKKRVEDQVKEIPLAIYRAIDRERHRHFLEAEGARRRAEEAERQRLAEEARRAEAARVKSLLSNVDAWRQSQALRQYLTQFKELAYQTGRDLTPGSELDNWLQWADEVADRLDPFSDWDRQESQDNAAHPVKPR